ncbi:hypothetical protein CPAR01_11554 [Colletotrichum paranaense]|uniref:Uncharacterized protein n=1 Tax=Colletotrichum paranaense TaxID=1914294 RepID=A0ABQ9SBZ3_9PEZI|nr:uncharacterized protein CPAR01_11554 [Colletotrichum paranaense]KAK1531905.1 hypothetical protein CPAR01_11554 [Colletotrichum paranaense]
MRAIWSRTLTLACLPTTQKPLPISNECQRVRRPDTRKPRRPNAELRNPQDLEAGSLLVVVTSLPFLMISSQHAFLPIPIPVFRFVVLDLGAPKYVSTHSRKAMFNIGTNLRQMVGSWAACVASEYALAASLGRPM